ncbi:MAG: Fe(3+) ABC transporter substrate-binding protein [Arenicella sp.]|nr:Fe(3+) ABC transporter substrate-binding protein [Arenicella sp.]
MKIALTLITAIFLGACQQHADEEVNLYSARNEALMKPLLDAFSQETGIKVNLISSKADALLTRIKSEGNNSPADVLLTTDAGRLHRAKLAGIFTAINSATLDKAIPSQYRDPQNQWFGLSVRARPIMSTQAATQMAITRYEDLADPLLAKQICIRSSGNIYNQSLVAAAIEANGEASTETWVKGLVANFARSPQGGDRDQIRAAAAGQCSIVVANTYYLANMLSNKGNADDLQAGSKMTVIWPNQEDRGTHVNVSGAGVLKTAPNKNNAIKLIEFLASDTAQKLYAEVNFEYPVKVGIELHPILKSWGTFKADPLPLSKLGENNADAVKLMDRAGWK